MIQRHREHGRSSTADILGTEGRAGRVHGKWLEFHRSLREHRERFLSKKKGLVSTAREAVPSSPEHIADSATESYDRDWALAMISSDQNALYEIDQAISRIADGTYGICELTGKPIEPERLKAVPWTRYCAKAQAELESRGGCNRPPQLGSIGSLDTGRAEEDSEVAILKED